MTSPWQTIKDFETNRAFNPVLEEIADKELKQLNTVKETGTPQEIADAQRRYALTRTVQGGRSEAQADFKAAAEHYRAAACLSNDDNERKRLLERADAAADEADERQTMPKEPEAKLGGVGEVHDHKIGS